MDAIIERLRKEPVLLFSALIIIIGALGPGWPVVVAGVLTSLLRLFVSPADSIGL